MGYQYKIVPFIGQSRGRLSASDVATQLESVISQHAALGWEFYQLSDVNIEVQPGCIAGLFGASVQYVRFDQLIFRAGERATIRPTPKAEGQRHISAGRSGAETDHGAMSPEQRQDSRVDRPPPGIKSKTEELWRQKSDEQVRAALGALNEYTLESRQVILEEFEGRSLEVSTESERSAVEAFRHGRKSPEPVAVEDRREDEALLYCYHCGSDVPYGANRCAACGNDL